METVADFCLPDSLPVRSQNTGLVRDASHERHRRIADFTASRRRGGGRRRRRETRVRIGTINSRDKRTPIARLLLQISNGDSLHDSLTRRVTAVDVEQPTSITDARPPDSYLRVAHSSSGCHGHTERRHSNRLQFVLSPACVPRDLDPYQRLSAVYYSLPCRALLLRQADESTIRTKSCHVPKHPYCERQLIKMTAEKPSHELVRH